MPARYPCDSVTVAWRISLAAARRPTSSLARLAAEQDRSTILALNVSSATPCDAQRVDGLGVDTRRRLADHATEVDALDDRLEVDVLDDVLDRHLVDDGYEVELCEHVLGDLLHDHRDERRRFARLRACSRRAISFQFQIAVLDRAQRALDDRRPRRGARRRRCSAPRPRADRAPAVRPRARAPANAPGTRSSGLAARPVGGRDGGCTRAKHRAHRPARQPQRAEAPTLRAVAQHVGDPRRRRRHRLRPRHHRLPLRSRRRIVVAAPPPRRHLRPRMGAPLTPKERNVPRCLPRPCAAELLRARGGRRAPSLVRTAPRCRRPVAHRRPIADRASVHRHVPRTHLRQRDLPRRTSARTGA